MQLPLNRYTLADEALYSCSICPKNVNEGGLTLSDIFQGR